MMWQKIQGDVNFMDFSSIATWATIGQIAACVRLSSTEEDPRMCDLGASQVVEKVFEIIKNQNERAQFFLKCEELGLRGWKLFFAFTYPSAEDYNNFVQCVLKSDAAMINALREEEQKT
ncbi:MAG: hypothetical protein LVR00_00660 [Rhabdochlamydiaceae bacterium]|jgi:hypothetical protein